MLAPESGDVRIDLERDTGGATDLELEPVSSEEEDYASSPADYRITTYPADFTLETLHYKWRDGEIIIPEFQRGFVWKPAQSRHPEFQRAFVWKPDQSSRLIESFLVGLPVPPVYFYTERRSSNYLVIDGQQRLKSIFYFLEGRFGDDTPVTKKEFRLTGLNPNSRFQGRTFSDLWD